MLMLGAARDFQEFSIFIDHSLNVTDSIDNVLLKDAIQILEQNLFNFYLRMLQKVYFF
jgi:hypothetical protein